MTSPKGLSENELRTLYGLVKYPTLNDRELSDRINLKMSTVTAIKNRLKRKGFYRTFRAPMLSRLGCELLGVNFTKLNLIADTETKTKSCEKIVKDYPEIFFSVMDEGKLLFFSILKNYTDAKANIEHFYQTFSEKNYLENDETRFVFFPYEQAKVFNFFDYASLIKNTFEIKIEREPLEPVDVSIDKEEEIVLTKIEKKVFWGLTRYPELLDNSIAKHIGVTRQSIAKMRKKFESKGLLKTIRVPDLKKLGFEILIFAHFIYNPRTTMESRKDSIKKILTEIPLILIVTSNMEGILLAVTRNYTECQRYVHRAIRWYKEKNFLRDDPTIMLFPLDDMIILNEHDYANLVKKLFSIDDVN